MNKIGDNIINNNETKNMIKNILKEEKKEKELNEKDSKNGTIINNNNTNNNNNNPNTIRIGDSKNINQFYFYGKHTLSPYFEPILKTWYRNFPQHYWRLWDDSGFIYFWENIINHICQLIKDYYYLNKKVILHNIY